MIQLYHLQVLISVLVVFIETAGATNFAATVAVSSQNHLQRNTGALCPALC